MVPTAAKAALRRKKQYEHTLEQTSAQMMTVEREIASIETANINKETLDAMKNASAAMKHIHKGLTVDKVDQTMCVEVLHFLHTFSLFSFPFSFLFSQSIQVRDRQAC